MKRPDKIRKMQEELICEIHPYTIQSVGKGSKRVCQHCIRDKKHQRDIVKGRVQITYTKPKEILTPMGNNIR